jgi:hypothetical protein
MNYIYIYILHMTANMVYLARVYRGEEKQLP